MTVCRFTAPFALALTILAALRSGQLQANETERAAVEQASAQFYAALNALFQGDVEPMKDVWSHADDVTYMGPGGGIQIGWNQVLATWEAQAAKMLGGTVTGQKLHFTVGHDLAVVECYEIGDNFAKGMAQSVNIRATSIFRKENGQWKMIGHHTDLLPYLE